jgi:hypothetical protein
MTTPLPISTVCVLADLQPLAGRLRSALRQLSGMAAEALDHEAGRTGRAVLFRGAPQEALRLDQELRAAGLTTTVNRLG